MSVPPTRLLALLVLSAWSARVDAAELRRASADFAEQYAAAPRQERLRLIQANGVKQTALDLKRAYLKRLNTRYRVEIPLAKRSRRQNDQAQSGRCWIFAATRVIESGMVKRGLSVADLSEGYANYHAWQTRSRAILARMAEAEQPLSIVNVQGGFGEGGWFHWAAQLIERHGMVPAEAMPETYDGANTDLLANRLQDVLARAQDELNTARGPKDAKQRAAIVERAQRQVTKVLDTLLGTPPERFTYRGKRYTPQEYAREVLGYAPREYVLLANLPSSETETNAPYHMRGMNGFAGARLLNVSPKVMEVMTRKTLDRGDAVWFTAQMGEQNPHEISESMTVPPQAKNALHLAAFDYQRTLGVPFARRAARIDANTGWANHAMAFVGYDYDRRAPTRTTKFKVDNSWGLTQHMYTDFFREYVDMIAVPKELLPARLRRQLDGPATVERLPLNVPK